MKTGKNTDQNKQPVKIAVASGKGGTGKTTVSVNLYHFSNLYWDKTLLVDCDVEEPNDALFFEKPEVSIKKEVFQQVPEIDIKACTFCKRCTMWCEFNAITVVSKLNYAEINVDLCHSCGACLHACQFGAIKEYNQSLGQITKYDGNGIGEGLLEGRLKVGSTLQTLLIKRVKQEVSANSKVIIYDAPPGTSCPVVETVSDANYVILVTEPTPFGVHDLKITVGLMNQLNKPFGILINKAGLGNNEVYEFLKENNLELLGEIPFSKVYSAKYAAGNILKNSSAETAEVYQQLIKNLKQKFNNWQPKSQYLAEKAVPEKQ